MEKAESEGLGLSVLVYVGAILGALAVLTIPAYYATRAEVHPNPPLAQSDPLLNSTVIGDRLANRFPLERLQPQNLADAETTKLLTTKNRKAEPSPRVASRPPRRDGRTPVAELQAERSRPSILPFSLF